MAKVGNNVNIASPFGSSAEVKQKNGKFVPANAPEVPARKSASTTTAPRSGVLNGIKNDQVDINQLAQAMVAMSQNANAMGTFAGNAQGTMNAEATLQAMKQTTEMGLMTALRNGNETLAKIWKAGSEAVKGLV